MARLIDADALLKRISSDELTEYVFGRHGVQKMIVEAPTVESIPIEWLKCKKSEHNNDGFAWIFEAVMDDWRKENETD